MNSRTSIISLSNPLISDQKYLEQAYWRLKEVLKFRSPIKLFPELIYPYVNFEKPFELRNLSSNTLCQHSLCRSEQTISQIIAIGLLRSSNVESNPGPATDQSRCSQDDRELHKDSTTLVATYNVRGLNDEKKLRNFLNRVYKY